MIDPNWEAEELARILASDEPEPERMTFEEVETMQILHELGADSLTREGWHEAVGSLVAEVIAAWEDADVLENELAEARREIARLQALAGERQAVRLDSRQEREYAAMVGE